MRLLALCSGLHGVPKLSINEILGNEALRKFNAYAQVRSCCTSFPICLYVHLSTSHSVHLSVPLFSLSPSPSPFPFLPLSSSLFLFPIISLCQPNPVPCPWSLSPSPCLSLFLSLFVPVFVSFSLSSLAHLSLSPSLSSHPPVLFLCPLVPPFPYPSLSPHPPTTTLPPHRAALVGTGTS